MVHWKYNRHSGFGPCNSIITPLMQNSTTFTINYIHWGSVEFKSKTILFKTPYFSGYLTFPGRWLTVSRQTCKC